MEKKLIVLLLAFCLVIGMLAGCGSQSAPAPAESASAPVSEQEASAGEPAAEAEPAAEQVAAEPAEEGSAAEEPISAEEPEPEPEPEPEGPVAGDKDFDWSTIEPLCEEKQTLTMFYTQPPALAAIMDSPNDTSYLYQTFEEVFNVHIDFHMVSMMDATTTFQLMIASGDYDDIINDALNYYTTGDQAYEDGVALDILEYQECVPHFMDILEEYPQVEADLKTLEGRVVNFPNLPLPLEDVPLGGFLIRQDWLDALGMDIPRSYDEMHDVLAAFKSEYGCTDPYAMPYQVLSPWSMMDGGYGVPLIADANNFYLDMETDTIELGTISDAYYEFLCMFRDWYDEGIINSDFMSYTMNLPDENLVANQMTGIWYSDQAYIKTFQDLLAEVNPDAELSLMKQPGRDAARSGYIKEVYASADYRGFSVSSCCEDPELAFRWCDIWYDPALKQFINYGYEGETFEYNEDHEPILGGIITNNDLGLPSLRMSNGVFLCTSGGFAYDRHKLDLEFNELQIESYTGWTTSADDPSTVTTSEVPTGVKMDSSQGETVTIVMSDVNTEVAEMALKFVTGATPLNEDTYADYVKAIEGMRVSDALDAMQAAYEHYKDNME